MPLRAVEGVTTHPFDADRLFALMAAREVELLLISTRHNTRYLTGGYYYPLYMWDAHARRTQYLSFVGIRRGLLGDSFFVGRPGEGEVLQEADVWIPHRYESMEISSLSTAAKTVEILKERNLDGGRIAVELPSLPADVFQVLKEQLPRAELIDAVPMLDGLRAVKRPEEIAIIRQGGGKCLQGLQAVLSSGRDGVSTAEIARRVAREFRQQDLHFLYALVCAGPSYFRAASEKRFWRRDQLLHIDAGGMADGYIVELCRTGYLGKPAGIADELLQGCRDLEQEVLPALRPGQETGAVQRRADAFLERHALGRYGKFIAHGIGLVHHEDPLVHARCTDRLEPGMVLSIEMEFRHPAAGHVKIEDMVAITGNGHELLSPGGGDWQLSSP